MNHVLHAHAHACGLGAELNKVKYNKLYVLFLSILHDRRRDREHDIVSEGLPKSFFRKKFI